MTSDQLPRKIFDLFPYLPNGPVPSALAPQNEKSSSLGFQNIFHRLQDHFAERVRIDDGSQALSGILQQSFEMLMFLSQEPLSQISDKSTKRIHQKKEEKRNNE